MKRNNNFYGWLFITIFTIIVCGLFLILNNNDINPKEQTVLNNRVNQLSPRIESLRIQITNLMGEVK